MEESQPSAQFGSIVQRHVARQEGEDRVTFTDAMDESATATSGIRNRQRTSSFRFDKFCLRWYLEPILFASRSRFRRFRRHNRTSTKSYRRSHSRSHTRSLAHVGSYSRTRPNFDALPPTRHPRQVGQGSQSEHRTSILDAHCSSTDSNSTR